ncbi:aminoglycoside 6-adenylyltransferase [Maledivibacter halophilus]|uniref:Aminoglycoside 6-adenylyltransferase n=1 Tax=Maledivibacter halophilus TaxID=36842 RepID=A0A1T5M264_9FIRM|nr:aminoglycoside 6-adenylyltransferase [Maledivibacter halophilus]SKC82104.1 aminoglycoside 6-adenylyltransferase [Maledivibacter halophilus]
MRTESEVLSQFKGWAKRNDLIRGAVLTSSRVVPDASIDFLSDYDIELYVSEIGSFEENDDWLKAFGSIMVRWPFKPRSTGKKSWITRLVLFKDGVRIDFQITDQFEIEPDTYDNGYKVLIDKDNIFNELSKPTFSQYLIKKPSKEEYETLANEFWWDAYYVPKYLWRDELPFAKYMLDYILRYLFLNKIIEWYIGMKNNWLVNTGACGKKFKRYLDSKTWSEFEETYAGADVEENWKAFFKTTDFFRKIAKQVGENLGYEYPDNLDKEVVQFCLKIRETDKF